MVYLVHLHVFFIIFLDGDAIRRYQSLDNVVHVEEHLLGEDSGAALEEHELLHNGYDESHRPVRGRLCRQHRGDISFGFEFEHGVFNGGSNENATALKNV